jgi:hypothetical protein
MLNPPRKADTTQASRTNVEPLRDAAGDAGDHPVRLRSPELWSHTALPP